MARFAHRMPFGAELATNGGVRFRLWAPGLEKVSLALESADAALDMHRSEYGWFEFVTDRARPGSTYRFEMADGLRIPDHDEPSCEGVAGQPLFRRHPGIDYAAGGARPGWSVTWLTEDGARA